MLIRDAGSPSDTRWIDDREDLPKIIRAGRYIARTRRYIRDDAHEIEPGDLVAYVAQEARRGDGWVKLVGGWIDRDAGDRTACWPCGEVEAAIAEAHRLGARVTAHCFAEESLRDLVEAGIDCVEHATGLTEDTIPLFAERGVAIVPTLVNIATFPDLAAGGEAKFPRWSAHMRQLYDRRYDTVRSAYDAGIPVYVGTDAGGSLAHGLVSGEVAELVQGGIPPLEALSATAWGARRWLGRPGLDEGVSGGPGRVRRGPPRGRPGAGGAPAHRAERAGHRLSRRCVDGRWIRGPRLVDMAGPSTRRGPFRAKRVTGRGGRATHVPRFECMRGVPLSGGELTSGIRQFTLSA
ncbi:hypothetical protein SBADM41S_01893 [Streptomyces badius]